MPQSIKPWDVVIIGGGVAGGSAAIQLARNGKNVLLIEKEAAAHDKVCGEFLSVEAQNYLQKLGINLQKLGAVPVSEINIIYKDKVISAKLPFCALSLSRRVLDEAILCEAQKCGALIRRNTEVVGLTQETQGWRINIHHRETIEAQTVFVATGKHDLRGWRCHGGIQNDFIGFKMHFELSTAQQDKLNEHIEFVLFEGGYAGLEPIEGGKVNLCLLVTKKYFSQYGKKWDELLNAICKETPLLAARLTGADPCWPKPLSIFGIPYGYVYRTPSSNPAPGLYRLGDQMAVIPSLSGYGISIALHTASLAVESYLHTNIKNYYLTAQQGLLPMVRRTTFLSHIINGPLAKKCLFFACRIRPKLITAFVAYNRLS